MLYPAGAKITLQLVPLLDLPLLDVPLQDHHDVSCRDGYQEQTTSEMVDASWTSLLHDLCKYSESRDYSKHKQGDAGNMSFLVIFHNFVLYVHRFAHFGNVRCCTYKWGYNGILYVPYAINTTPGTMPSKQYVHRLHYIQSECDVLSYNFYNIEYKDYCNGQYRPVLL